MLAQSHERKVLAYCVLLWVYFWSSSSSNVRTKRVSPCNWKLHLHGRSFGRSDSSPSAFDFSDLGFGSFLRSCGAAWLSTAGIGKTLGSAATLKPLYSPQFGILWRRGMVWGCMKEQWDPSIDSYLIKLIIRTSYLCYSMKVAQWNSPITSLQAARIKWCGSAHWKTLHLKLSRCMNGFGAFLVWTVTWTALGNGESVPTSSKPWSQYTIILFVLWDYVRP